MPETKYAIFEALNPFFEIIQKGLSGLVDGDMAATQTSVFRTSDVEETVAAVTKIYCPHQMKVPGGYRGR